MRALATVAGAAPATVTSMRNTITRMVREASQAGRLWAIDWATHPLPSLQPPMSASLPTINPPATPSPAAVVVKRGREAVGDGIGIAAPSAKRGRWDSGGAATTTASTPYAGAMAAHAVSRASTGANSAPLGMRRALGGPPSGLKVFGDDSDEEVVEVAAPSAVRVAGAGSSSGVKAAAHADVEALTAAHAQTRARVEAAAAAIAARAAAGKAGKLTKKQAQAAAAAATALSSAASTVRVVKKAATRMPSGATTTAASGGAGGGVTSSTGLQLMYSTADDLNEDHWAAMVVRGTCTTLEKRYFRLIGVSGVFMRRCHRTHPCCPRRVRAALPQAADPATVRPQPILEAALALVLRRHGEGADYKAYVNDQLKSIRQDITVQHLHNNFAVAVYETHARIALEHRDAAEFNQCQTQLALLYGRGLGSAASRTEFAAYRLLYYLYANAPSDAVSLMRRLTAGTRREPAVRHALSVRTAVARNDYHRCGTPPALGANCACMRAGARSLARISVQLLLAVRGRT